jgi:TRAP-type uncharacterized transport system substrate-binding protein
MGFDSETETVGINALLVVGAEVPETLVYAITKSLWGDATKQMLAARHPMGQRIMVQHALEGIDIPLHPGAERYYREAGILNETAKQ